MKRLFILMLALFITSCATTKESSGLFESYKTYSNKIIKNKSNFIMSMLSKKRVEEIEKLGEKEFPVLSEFSKVLYKIESHYQKIGKNQGCLTINGYGKNNKPIVLSITYLNENKRWVINFVEIYYADSTKEFHVKGICPSES